MNENEDTAMTAHDDKRAAVSPAELIELTTRKPAVPEHAGLREGDEGKTVSQLQDYLKTSGYLGSETLEAFGVPRGRAVAEGEVEGVFDATTAEALRGFQEFNNLPVTGELDEDTVEVLGVAEDNGLPVGADLGLLVDGTDALGLEHLQRSVDVLHLMCAQHARTRPIVDATSAN